MPQRPRRTLVAAGLLVIGIGGTAYFFAPERPALIAERETPAVPRTTALAPSLPPRGQHVPSLPAEISTPLSDSLSETSPTIASLQALATREPARALGLALAEPDEARRDELLQAVLRGWARADADAAADWARNQSYFDHGQAVAAVFNGANQTPTIAMKLAARLAEEDPENAGAYAGYLIFSLGEVKQFALAATTAAESTAELRVNLLTAAYHTWGQHQPQLALAAAAELSDPAIRRTAMEAAIGGWAKKNPREVTGLALEFPSGAERQLALTTALRNWIDQDPAAVAEWAKHAKYFPEMESALEE